MAQVQRQQTVLEILQNLRDLSGLKKLFWEELNYERANKPLSMRGWPDSARSALADDPILFATGGEENSFHIVYCRLSSESLLRGIERSIINQLIREHPYCLFVFSDKSLSHWHFLNVKYDEREEKRRLFRRIIAGPGERLRTAAERIALLDLESISPDLFDLSPLRIQQNHDDAFDVEPVTREFFTRYREIFEAAEGQIGIKDNERKRLYTQRLFNRLMFVIFIQKKGWLTYDGRTDYLDALWESYLKDRKSDSNFYIERLRLLFFTGLSTKHDVDIIGINRGGFLKKIIGAIPYLNGGLFEEDDDDRDSSIVVPDECCRAILEDLFARFNFTVCESTPLDVDVAVDPEMLGKVFEELVTGRHESGSYYTPKPIVSFMCKEGLKGYLVNSLPGEKPEALARFVDSHEPDALKDPEAVLDALRCVRFCDLACGSGAYLLGMLHELITLRECLFATEKIDAVSMHTRKLEIIQNNLYGVDIDPFAVNIARLRLWLSLAVEFDGDVPPPLPNLDFKIETGDSVLGPSSKDVELGVLHVDLVRAFQKLKAEFMVSHLSRKVELRKTIAKAKTEIAEWTHQGKMKSGFDWPVEFAEVFTEGGFDIILANPPYIRQELIKEIKPVLKDKFPEVYCGTADLYCYFYARSVDILRAGGMLIFISSNKWFRANYGVNLRKYLAKNCSILSITDFGELPVFENAATFPMIFVAQKTGGRTIRPKTILTQVKSLDPPYPDVFEIIATNGQVLPENSIQGAAWLLTDVKSADRLRKMEKAGIPLGEYVQGHIYYGIKTGFNEAFVINGETHNMLIAKDSKSKEVIFPLAVGDDIRKWRIENKNRYLIVTPIGIDIKRYPAIFKHLKQYQKALEKRWDKGDHWWELRACDYYDIFKHPKILYPEIAKEPRFTLDNEGIYPLKTVFSIPKDDLYLLGVLNSSSAWDYLKNVCSVLGDAENRGRLTLQSIFVGKLPIPRASASEMARIEQLVKKCLKARGEDCDAWEHEINERVAALYGLNT